jgi:tight adherence protein B
MRRAWPLVPLIAGLLAGPAFAATDQAPVQIRGVEVAGHPTVAITISTTAAVTPEDVTVKENDRPSPVLSVRPLESGALDVILAIDTSNSIRGGPLASALDAARLFVDKLPAEVPIGIVTFSDQARLLLPITEDHQAVLQALDGITQTQRGTRLHDGLALAASTFRGAAQHNIILLTDGVDTGQGEGGLDLDTATTRAQGANATVFTIGLEGTKTDFSALETIADRTGGAFNQVSSGNLSQLYQTIADRLSHQYVILFESKVPGGAQVTITVQTPLGTDTSSVLLPRSAATASAGRDWLNFPLGTTGLILTLALAFLATFGLLALALGAGARGRRDRILGRRMAARAVDLPGVPARPDQGPTAWMPQPFIEAADAVAEAAGLKGSLEQKLERAGLAMSPGEVLGASFAAAVAGLILGGLIFRSVLFALVVGAVGAYIPFLLLSRRMKKRLNRLNDQLPDILMTLASSMRAGHSFLQALDTVSKEVPDPAGPEFNRVVTEIRLGRPFEEAMSRLGERVGTEEFKWATLAINVQREVGGNLAEVLDTLSETVRERDQIRRQIRVLSAEGRISVKILIAMPFLIALYMTLVNREYMELLWSTKGGLVFMGAGAVLMVIGAIWSSRVVKIDV